MNDWGQPQHSGHSFGGGKPAAAAKGQNLSADDLQLRATQSRGSLDPMDLIKTAFEYIKERPVEALGVPLGILVILMIANMIISFILNIFTGLIVAGIGGVAGNSGAGEAAFIVATLFSVITSLGVSFFFAMLQAVAIGALNILWLRIVRGQDASLNHLISIKNFALPLILGGLAFQAAVTLGFILFIVPGLHHRPWLLLLGLYRHRQEPWPHRSPQGQLEAHRWPQGQPLDLRNRDSSCESCRPHPLWPGPFYHHPLEPWRHGPLLRPTRRTRQRLPQSQRTKRLSRSFLLRKLLLKSKAKRPRAVGVIFPRKNHPHRPWPFCFTHVTPHPFPRSRAGPCPIPGAWLKGT